ncbi:MAG TPA: alpha/beta fold hydrolase [Planctomycetota bacterium]
MASARSSASTDFGAIRNPAGERLDYAFHPGAADSDVVVVVGHGVTGNKDREWALVLAETLSAAGLAALRLSFAGNGASEGDFRASCPTKEAAELGAVLERLAGRRVAFAGHSMGAAVGVLRASTDRRIAWLVSLAGMVDTEGFVARKFGHLVAGRDCMWDKPDCPFSQEFLADMLRIGSVEVLGASVHAPWLLVHGNADTVVPLAESERMSDLYGADLWRLPGADHVFSGAHAARMAEVVTAWLLDHGAASPPERL